MAPEILLGDKYDGRCDIYSLGACLFNLLTGKYPFYETNLKRFNLLLKYSKFKFPKNVKLSE